MANLSHPLHRLTHVSHLLTGLMLTATGAAFLLPLSAHSAGRRTAAPTEARHQVASTSTQSSLATRREAPSTIPVTATTTSPSAAATPTTPPAPAPAVPLVPVREAAPAVPGGYGCALALAYLTAHAAPGFTLECPAWADGHQAMSCDNVPGICPGTKLIAISTPCPAAYMNEASNSWVVLGESNAALDPYGYCY